MSNHVPMRRRLVIGFLAVLPVLVFAGWASYEYWPRDPPPPLAAPRDPILPDLAMAALVDLVGGVTEEDEAQQLLFSASVANRGPGPFIVNAVRGDERGPWRVSQRFLEVDGSTTETATPADMTWAGHGHNHWHVRIGAAYALYTLPDMEKVRSLEKVGYCFFDQKPYDRTLEGAPKQGVFPKSVCNGKATLGLSMGLSAGWQDPYTWALPDQRLDITGLPDGRYRLLATADPNNWFREVDETNNDAWADIELEMSSYPPAVTLIERRPAPPKG